jgi:hypothetical protein
VLKAPRPAADCRIVLARHGLSVGIVAIAVSLTGAFFVLERPQYRVRDAQPLPYVMPAAHDWVWANGIPGFRIGQDEARWNRSNIGWDDLAPLRAVAKKQDVNPQTIRVLDGTRLDAHARPLLLVAGSDPSGGTCIGAQASRIAFLCDAQLRNDVAVFVAAPQPPSGSTFAVYVNGVVRGDVTRATIQWQGGEPEQFYVREGNHTWGTFTESRGGLGSWNAQIDLFGEGGRLASVPLRFTKPGAFLYCASALPGTGAGCAQRRS